MKHVKYITETQTANINPRVSQTIWCNLVWVDYEA